MEKRGRLCAISKKIRSSPFLLIPAVLVAALVNTLLDRMNVLLALPFFLDSIFTAVNAALFGIVPGVVTGILTNVFMEIGYGMENLHWQWGLCNAATGLVVGLAAVKGRFGTLLELCIVIAGVTLANSLIGATLAVYLFGGITGSPVDFIVVGLAAAGRSIFSSAFLARIVSNLIDKSIAVVVAYVLYQYVREDKVPYIVGG